MAGDTARLSRLTSLRYIAALAVVVTHVNPYFLTSHWQRAALAYGYVGVSFFFLLSGFVLTWSCAEQAVPRFWWNRLARIWPLQALMMAVTYAALWQRVSHPGGGLGWVLQFLVLQAWSPDQRVHAGGNGPTWTLSCEFFFYAMFPLIVRGVARLRGRGVALATAATCAILAVAPLLGQSLIHAPAMFQWLFYYLPAYRVGEFMIGMLLARAVRLGLRVPTPGYLAALAGLAAWLWALAQATGHNHGTGVTRPFVAVTVLPLLALVVATGASLDLRETAAVLGRGWAVRLGEWSFALYLVHSPLISFVSARGWLSDGGRPGGAGFLAAFIALATGLAAIAHYLVERPAERWLRDHMPGGHLPRAARVPGGPRGAHLAAGPARADPGGHARQGDQPVAPPAARLIGGRGLPR